MIKLHQFPKVWDIPNSSPFCWKVEAYLRMTKRAFESVDVQDPRKAPKGKLPFIDDDGEIVADSSAIIDHLEKKYGDPLGDAKRSQAQRASDHMLRRMTEEHFYWVLLYSRWIDEAGWRHTHAYLRAGFPPLVRSIVPGIIRGSLDKQLVGQGLGRHSSDEIYARGKADLTAISTVLGEAPYFGGDEPAGIDATMSAFLGTALLPPFDTTPKALVKSFDNLARYTMRMHERFFTNAS